MRTYKSLPKRKIGTFTICNKRLVRMTRKGWKPYTGESPTGDVDLSITGEKEIIYKVVPCKKIK